MQIMTITRLKHHWLTVALLVVQAPVLSRTESSSFQMPSLLSGGGGEDRIIPFVDIIRPLIEVRCQADRMHVLLHYNIKYSQLTPAWRHAFENATVYLSASTDSLTTTNTNCHAVNDAREGALVLETSLDECDVEHTNNHDGTISYVGQLHVLDSSQTPMFSRQTISVECLHPQLLRTSQMEPFNSTLSLYNSSRSTQPRIRSTPVKIGEKLWLDANAALEWYDHKDLSAFVSRCWVSPTSTDETSTSSIDDKQILLSEGCVHNGANRKTVSKVFPQPESDRFRVEFRVTHDLINPDHTQSYTQPDRPINEVIFIHCQVQPCLVNHTKGVYNVPKCPRAGYCTGVTSQSHQLPSYIRQFPTTHIATGPVVVTGRPDRRRQNRFERDCSMLCKYSQAHKQTQQQLNVDLNRSNRHLQQSAAASNSMTMHAAQQHNGISVSVTVLCALTSFALGAGLMAGVWLVHVQTDVKHTKSNTTHHHQNGQPFDSAFVRNNNRNPYAVMAANGQNHTILNGNPDETQLFPMQHRVDSGTSIE